jgi:hypothetical protein
MKSVGFLESGSIAFYLFHKYESLILEIILLQAIVFSPSKSKLQTTCANE